LLLVAVQFNSCLRADKYLSKVVDQPSNLHTFFFSSLQILYFFVQLLTILGIFSNLHIYIL